MHNAYGHLEGTITKIEDHGQGHLILEVKAVNGVICHVCDIYCAKRPFPAEVGMKILLEEATVMFDNGRIIYCVDEELRRVELNGIDLGRFMPMRD